MSPKVWKGDRKSCKSEDKPTLAKLKHCWDRQEYREESRRSEETFCYSDSSERPSAKAAVSNLQGEW